MIPLVAPLFVPGDRPERFAKAEASGTDMVIIDLEDAVAGTAKARARDIVTDYLAAGGRAVVRINSPSSAEFEADIMAMAQTRPAGIMVPKFESAEDARRLRAVCGEDISIIALIETPGAFRDLPTLLAEGRVLQAAVGTLDLAAELECNPESRTIEHARSMVVLASCIAGVAAPLDGVTANITDEKITAADAQISRSLGFHGKLCIHPRQVQPILAAFLPGSAEIGWARAVLTQAGKGASKVGGEMIDAPVIRRAERILREASNIQTPTPGQQEGKM